MVALLAGGFFCSAQQNLKENFHPLKSSGTLPDIFTQKIRDVIKGDIDELNKQNDVDQGIKSNYLAAANYEIDKIVRSGNTLINDEVTKYLNEVAAQVLKDDPALLKQLHIYTYKSPVVNAYSYDKGYIFIDIGLVAQTETEAQLAFILAHEISHYVKKHNINSYVQNTKIDRSNYEGKSGEDKLIEKCQYSKEHESEADIEGFKLVKNTNYDLRQAEKAFDVLQYAHLPFELVEFKKNYFNHGDYKIPDGYFLKEVSAIRNNSDEDDTKHTHPNTAKRKQAIGALIAKADNAGRVNYIISKDKFEYIRDLSRMELCRLYLRHRDYPNAFYAAYILEQKYPDNEYLSEILSKCMYALTLYSQGDLSYDSDSYLESGIPSYSEIESYPQQLYYLVKTMPSNEWTFLALDFVYRRHKRFPDNKAIDEYQKRLFKIVEKTDWGISDFVRTNVKAVPTEAKPDSTHKTIESISSKTDLIASLQKERESKNTDTLYYKDIYVDLFMNDKEFKAAFPQDNANKTDKNGFSSYSPGKSKRTEDKDKKTGSVEIKVDKAILLEPFYLKIDEKKDEVVRYLDSDNKQGKFVETLGQSATRQNFTLLNLDPAQVTAGEVDKVNDYSVLNDWFNEKFDSKYNKTNLVLNTNEIDDIIKKYGTGYVLKTGFVNYKSRRGRKFTYHYVFLYDLVANKMVYKKQETFRGKDTRDLVNAKAYQTIYSIKHLKTTENL